MSMYDHCFYFNLSALTRKITKIWEVEFEKFGLSPSQAYLLFAIIKNPKASHKTLSKMLELDPSTITRFLDILENKKLIVRIGKGKASEYLVTKEGKSIGKKVEAQMDVLFKRMQTHFGENIFNNLVSKLHVARESLDD